MITSYSVNGIGTTHQYSFRRAADVAAAARERQCGGTGGACERSTANFLGYVRNGRDHQRPPLMVAVAFFRDVDLRVGFSSWIRQ